MTQKSQGRFGISRRTVLTTIGAGIALGTTTGSAAAQGQGGSDGSSPKKGTVRKMGQTILEPSPAADVGPHFAEESIRSDGQYAVVGVFQGEIGSFLVDISNPRDPTETHRIDSPSFATRHADVKFDRRDGLYYRSLEGDNTGVDVIDYGFDEGTAEDPEILTRMDAGSTHNMVAHPEEDVLYTANEGDAEAGMSVWDVSDPADPEHVTFAGVAGEDEDDYKGADLHDVVVDPDRDLAHLAYIGDQDETFDGYQILDVSDPMDPVEEGRVDYAPLEDYTEEKLENGEAGFESCHYADYDPERDIAIVGDELGFGAPGGKHVFDIGWDEGSPSDPEHIGFTYSPNAELMDEGDEFFDWTTHNHDVVSKGSNTLLVSGDYHEGAVSYDISDPTDPSPTDTYETDDREDEAGETLGFIGDAPMAWGVDYADERDFTVVSDMVTGLYVFKFTPDASESQGGGNGNGNG